MNTNDWIECDVTVGSPRFVRSSSYELKAYKQCFRRLGYNYHSIHLTSVATPHTMKGNPNEIRLFENEELITHKHSWNIGKEFFKEIPMVPGRLNLLLDLRKE